MKTKSDNSFLKSNLNPFTRLSANAPKAELQFNSYKFN